METSFGNAAAEDGEGLLWAFEAGAEGRGAGGCALAAVGVEVEGPPPGAEAADGGGGRVWNAMGGFVGSYRELAWLSQRVEGSVQRGGRGRT